MKSTSPHFRFQSFVVPRQNETALLEPDMLAACELAFQNERLLGQADVMFGGRKLAALRIETQRAFVQAAWNWTKRYAEKVSPAAAEELSRRVNEHLNGEAASLFVTGHQPELYHCGVWFKNAVVSRLACCSHGLAINVMIDHDLAKHHSIVIPQTDDTHTLSQRGVPFAKLPPFRSWETLSSDVVDMNDNFISESLELTDRTCVDRPMLPDYWSAVRRLMSDGYKLGEAVAAARHSVELAYGWRTLEVPLSHICNTWHFGIFVAEVLLHGADTIAAYNNARQEYRDHHQITNAAQPIPALEKIQSDDCLWLEMPFWLYSQDQPERKPLWLAYEAEQWRITNRGEINFLLERSADIKLTERLWEELQRNGLLIRPRALMTTTFLRLFAADLFVHGIGGGKYDQVTDRMIYRLWGIVPPDFMVATASLHLPLDEDGRSSAEDPKVIAQMIWRAKYNPEQFLTAAQLSDRQIMQIAHEKKGLLSAIPARGHKKEWHNRVRVLNEQLEPFVRDRVEELRAAFEDSKELQRQSNLRSSREYSFVLFNQHDVLSRLTSLLPRRCPEAATVLEPAK